MHRPDGPVTDESPSPAVPDSGSAVSRRSFLDTSLASAAWVVMGPQPHAAASAPSDSARQAAIPSEALAFLTLADASARVRDRTVSPVELTRACLDRIARLNPTLNAFITITAESALAEARQAESEISRGHWRGALHGIPLALKDLLDTAGVRTTAGSGLYKDRVPAEDAEVVRRLRAAGAVLLGKLNMHEFAYGGSSAISYYGAVRNPWNPAHCAGGSSGGSAAAVAAHLCYGAIGSDTGGSIREPAGYCGIVGLKPTYGRVSTVGAIPLSWTLDHLGPLTRTVLDAALLLQALAGHDPRDGASIADTVPDYAKATAGSVAGLRLGVARDYFYEGLHPDIQAATDAALQVLSALGGTPVEVAALADDATYASVVDPAIALVQAEAYAYHQEYAARSPDAYQKSTLERILAGAKVTTPSYIHSRRHAELLRRTVSRKIAGADVLITPTSPVPPYTIADLQADPAAERPKEVRMLRNARPFNLYGMPAMSVPCGFTQSGLPIGLQITGAMGDEATVLRVADAYQRATGWHTRRALP